MRILHVSSGNLYGGIETFLASLARFQHLVPQVEHQFALCFEGRLSQELIGLGARLHLLGPARVSRPHTVWRARRNLKQVLRRQQYDAVVCHSAWPHALFAGEVRRERRPLIFWLHGVSEGTHWLDRWARRVPPDLALCNSQFTVQSLPRLWPEVKSRVLYYLIGAPSQTYSLADRLAVRAEFNTPPEATVIIQVSRMEEWKGHTLHLEALAALRDRPNWRCWFVGGAQRQPEGEYLESIKRKAVRLGLANRVIFTGQRTDVPRLLAAADLHCQPNLSPEPFGITYVEALWAGLPVVATAMGGACEIVEESCGILTAPGDVNALAQALGRLIEDGSLRAKLSLAGPSRARRLCDPEEQLNSLRHFVINELN